MFISDMIDMNTALLYKFLLQMFVEGLLNIYNNWLKNLTIL